MNIEYYNTIFQWVLTCFGYRLFILANRFKISNSKQYISQNYKVHMKLDTAKSYSQIFVVYMTDAFV